ncbi:MAG: type II toxin-antitoxin system VapC family toxin [Rectinemataceae bacterium]
MAAYLLDTSALLAHYRGEAGADRVQEILLDDSAEVFVASPSIAEFALRIYSLGPDAAGAREASLAYAGLVARVIPVDSAVAIRAFELALGASSRLPLIDALIAACAGTAEAILVHRDEHFEALASSTPARLMLSEG